MATSPRFTRRHRNANRVNRRSASMASHPRSPDHHANDSGAGSNAGLHVIQFIERLRVIAILRDDPNIRVAGDQTIHLVGRDAALVMVLESESSVGAATRQIGVELDPDLAASFFHLLDRRKFHRDQPGRQTMAVNRERQIAKHSLGVGPLLGLRRGLRPHRYRLPQARWDTRRHPG